MSTQHTGHTQPSIDLEEHRSVSGVNAKAVIPYNLNSAGVPIPAVSDAIAQAVYDALTRLQPLQHSIPYARDISDQMRVNVSQGSLTVNALTWANNGGYAAYYAQGAPNSIDAREQLELQSLTNFNLARNNRWTFA